MPTKKYIKSHSDDPFEKVTGVRLYEVDGQLNCRICPNSRMLFSGKQYMARFVAASIYLNIPVSEIKNVETTCDVKNCVKPSHIIVDGKNLRVKDNGDLETDTNIDKPDHFGYIHNVPGELWEKMTDEEKQRAREGNFDVVKEGFAISAR